MARASVSSLVTASCDGSEPVRVIVEVSKIATTGWGDPSGSVRYGVPGATDGLVAGVDGLADAFGAPPVVVDVFAAGGTAVVVGGGTGGRTCTSVVEVCDCPVVFADVTGTATEAVGEEFVGEESAGSDTAGNGS